MKRRCWAAGAIALAAILLSGCGEGKAVASGLEVFAGKARTDLETIVREQHKLPDGSIVVPSSRGTFTLPAASKPETLGSTVLNIVRPAAGLDDSNATKVIKAACTIKDVADVFDADSLQDQAKVALINFGGDLTLGPRVAELAYNMATAQSSGDALRSYAQFWICEHV